MAEERVNFASYLTFHWVNALMEKGSRGNLRTQDDLHDLPIYLRSDVIAQKVGSLQLLATVFLIVLTLRKPPDDKMS